MIKTSGTGLAIFLCAFAILCNGILCRAQGASAADWPSVERIVGRIHGVSTKPPADVVSAKFTTGALMGNGDVGIVAGDADINQQSFHFGKSDFWGLHWDAGHKATGVSILSFGAMTLSSPASGPNSTFTETASNNAYVMDQDILHAEVTTTVRMDGRPVHMRSWLADGDNVFVTQVWTDGSGSDSPDRFIPIAIDLSMPPPDSVLNLAIPAAAGNGRGILWVSRENSFTGADDYKARGAVATKLLGASFSGVAQEGTSVVGTFPLKDNTPVDIVTVNGGVKVGQCGGVKVGQLLL